MSDLLGGIESAVGGILGGLGGGSSSSSSGGAGDFLQELISAFEGGSSSQGDQSSGGMGDIGKIAGDVLPLAMAFL
jgi:hypothetical protein